MITRRSRWSVLGAVAARTDRIALITGVTCPTIRYHPVIIAQAAATIAAMSGGRLTLGLGAGERLNEHVTGAEFPSVDLRHAMLGEAITMMNELWSGEFVTHRGTFFDADHVKIYEHLGQAIDVVLAVSGAQSLDLAQETGCAGIMATEPDADLVSGWADRGGSTRLDVDRGAPRLGADQEAGHRDRPSVPLRHGGVGHGVGTAQPGPLRRCHPVHLR